MGDFIYITGGVRSGKSRYAEQVAAGLGSKVAYVATSPVTDWEMEARIAAHRARRPETWVTVEKQEQLPEVFKQIGGQYDTLLVECLTTYLSNWLYRNLGEVNPDSPVLRWTDNHQQELCQHMYEIGSEIKACPSRVIMVGNQVGWGVVPPYPLGRLFRDAAGLAEQIIVQFADQVFLVVAGLPLKLK